MYFVVIFLHTDLRLIRNSTLPAALDVLKYQAVSTIYFQLSKAKTVFFPPEFHGASLYVVVLFFQNWNQFVIFRRKGWFRSGLFGKKKWSLAISQLKSDCCVTACIISVKSNIGGWGIGDRLKSTSVQIEAVFSWMKRTDRQSSGFLIRVEQNGWHTRDRQKGIKMTSFLSTHIADNLVSEKIYSKLQCAAFMNSSKHSEFSDSSLKSRSKSRSSFTSVSDQHCTFLWDCMCLFFRAPDVKNVWDPNPVRREQLECYTLKLNQ